MFPWLESGFPPDDTTPDPQPSSDRRREAVRNAGRRLDERRRERDPSAAPIFGNVWQDDEQGLGREEDGYPNVDMGFWTIESHPQFAHLPRNVSFVREADLIRFMLCEGLIANFRIQATPWLDRYVHEQTVAPMVSQRRHPVETDAVQRRRRSEQRRREASARRGAMTGERFRNVILHRAREINGLGDRDRSLSPEVWDTLLTTLTPDPQPPSAGSSFASTAASQSAGVSSSTSLTSPGTREESAVDPACDSGCENSDTEANPALRPDHARLRRSIDDISRRLRARVADLTADGSVDGPTEPRSTRRAGSAPSSRATSRRQRPADDLMVAAAVDGNGSLSVFHNSRGPRHGWVGQLSVGTSDDEQGTERRSLNREGSAVSGNNTSQGEDDWLGMRRIVQSLARREDIPDEWWAEAGLNRTLPRDGAE